ncbi:serine/threonine protein kinase [bacterium]|nr:serine/threonine protein kinase [bacterium]
MEDEPPNPAATAVALPASERPMRQPFEAGAPVFGTTEVTWNLARELGRGGFGVVWLGTNHDTGEARAVKFFTHEVRRTDHAKHEMRVARHVLKHMRDHPEALANIVPLLATNLDIDPPWLMYRFVPGGRCLTHVIGELKGQNAAAREAVAVPLLRTVAAAVGRMHRLKTRIVHRDLKPSNVLMDGDTPLISDFGIGGASVIGAISDRTGGHTTMSANVNLLTHLRMSGTPLYACPQQLNGDDPDPRDDVYSLAVIAFQLLLGDPKATPGTDTRDVLEEAGVSDWLAALVARNLSSTIARRYADAAEMAEVLAACGPPG